MIKNKKQKIEMIKNIKPEIEREMKLSSNNMNSYYSGAWHIFNAIVYMNRFTPEQKEMQLLSYINETIANRAGELRNQMLIHL